MLSTKSSQGDGHEKVKGSDKTEDKEDERKEETRGFPAQWIIYIYIIYKTIPTFLHGMESVFSILFHYKKWMLITTH